jgi:4-hydroxy-tetrahydrodipicolinate synthase
MSQLIHCCLEGNFAAARVLQHQYLALMEVNFIESNPIPVKSAMALMGLLEPVYRLPMVPPKPENLEKIRNVLTHLGLLARSVPVAH